MFKLTELMDIEQSFQIAARQAASAVKATMNKYQSGLVTDEDDMTGVLLGRLDTAFDANLGGIKWSSSILRHRKGIANQEGAAGADMLIHVSLNSKGLKYSKGILIQAKRVPAGTEMAAASHSELLTQCNKMLAISPASFVFNYDHSGMRCASATRIAGTSSRVLNDACNLTTYRFFLELFRCTTGDPKITSAKFDELKIPHGISLNGTIAS